LLSAPSLAPPPPSTNNTANNASSNGIFNRIWGR
jgi:hypothetical protein